MAFHTCSSSTSCDDPTNHTIRLAESNDGSDWTEVSGWQGYRGSVPDIIRRESTLYVIGAGLSRVNLTTGQVTADSFYVRKTDGSDSLSRDTAFAGQLSDGRFVVVYVPSMQEVEGKTSVPVKLATEVVDSDGSSFVESATAVDVPLDVAGVHGMASDPDIFFNGTEWVLYVSMGSNVVSFTAPDITGPYSLTSASVVSQGSGGVPSAMVGGDGGVWVYVNDGPSRNDVSIRRAVTTAGTTLIPASSFQTVLTGAPFGATTAESPGVAQNVAGTPCGDGCKTPATVPGAPTDMTFTDVTTNSMVVNWSPPASDGGSVLLGYDVVVDGGSATRVTDPTHSLTGLNAGQTYAVSITAVNAVGSSSALTGSQMTVPPEVVVTAPGAVSSLKAGSVKKTSAKVTWKAPASDGGGAITAYETRLKASGGKWSSWVSQSATSTSGTFSKSLRGLKSGKTYYVQVRAKNSAGNGASTQVTFATTK